MSEVLNTRHEELMAMSVDDVNMWIEEAQIEDLLNPTNLKECPWILIPSSIGKNLAPLDSTDSDPIVPIRWFMGDISWYIVECDGNDVVSAYMADPSKITPTKARFNISQLNDLVLFSENETWRVYRDVNWNPNTKLSDITKKFSTPVTTPPNDFLDDDDDLVF